ncbi:MAG: hypothetical protein ACFHX7_22450 [Pseudomonadota bacterium]
MDGGAGVATLGLPEGLGMDGDGDEGEDEGDCVGLGGRCVCCGDEGCVVLQLLASSRLLITSGNRNCLALRVMVAPW